MKQMNQRGLGAIPILVAGVIILAGGFALWRIQDSYKSKSHDTEKNSDSSREEAVKIPFRDAVVSARLPKGWEYKVVEGLGIFVENQATGYSLALIYSSGTTGNGYAPTEQLGSVVTADGIAFTVHPYDKDPEKNAVVSAFATTCKPKQCNYIINTDFSFEVSIDKMINNQRQPLDLSSPNENLAEAVNLLSAISVKTKR